MSLPTLPPLNISGGTQASQSGDISTGTTGFGSFNYNSNSYISTIAIVIGAVVALYVVTRTN